MEKAIMLVASLAFGLLGISPAAMAQSLSNLGTPTCHGHNPAPDVVQGTFYFTLPTSDGKTYDSINPWKQFGLPRNATYSALEPLKGDVNDNATLIRYDFDKSLKNLPMIWGTPDPENIIRFFQVDRVHHSRIKIAEVTGYDVATAFGGPTTYLSIAMPAGMTFNQAVLVTSGRVDFEFADFNIRCKQ